MNLRKPEAQYAYVRQKDSEKKPAHLLGIGLDNEDGHKRITKAEEFSVVGGSEETHERLTETALKTFEELKTRGKKLNQVEPKELSEIIEKSTPE